MRKRIEMKFEGEFEILGHKVRLENIKNPHLRRAIEERASTFLFNYADKKDHVDHRIHSDGYADRVHNWEKRYHTEHTDYTAKYNDYYRVWGEYHAP